MSLQFQKQAQSITDIPGSSAYFLGSIVAYDNRIKENILGVSSKLIEQFGAVSSQVSESMAINVCKKFEFKNNSLIIIKDYILDKNERTLKKNNIHLKITEKEINFIEKLHVSAKPLSREFILKNIFKN